MNKFYHIHERWKGRSCYIIGGGASLIGKDLSYLAFENTIGCNDAFKQCPWIDITTFGDMQWFYKNEKQLKEFYYEQGQLITNLVTLYNYDWIDVCRRRNLEFWTNTDWELGWFENTGFLAMNIAAQMGVKKINLLGFDMKEVNGRQNWYRKNQSFVSNNTYKNKHLIHVPAIAKACKELNIEVKNLSNDSAIKEWK